MLIHSFQDNLFHFVLHDEDNKSLNEKKLSFHKAAYDSCEMSDKNQEFMTILIFNIKTYLLIH